MLRNPLITTYLKVRHFLESGSVPGDVEQRRLNHRCRKRFGTNSQYLRHLADDVLPVILRKAFEIAGVSTSK